MPVTDLINAFWSSTPFTRKTTDLPWFLEKVNVEKGETQYILIDKTLLCLSNKGTVLKIQLMGRGHGFILRRLNMLLKRACLRLILKYPCLILHDVLTGKDYQYVDFITINLENRRVAPSIAFRQSKRAQKLKEQYLIANKKLEATKQFVRLGLFDYQNLVCFETKGNITRDFFVVTINRENHILVHFGRTNLFNLFNAAKTHDLKNLMRRTIPISVETLLDCLNAYKINFYEFPQNFRAAFAIQRLLGISQNAHTL